MRTTAGIAGLGVHVPSGVMTAAEIAARAGLPEEVVLTRFGLVEKRVGAGDEHVSELCAEAARRALADASRRTGREIGPADVDALIYCGSPHKEYPVWLAAPRIQALLGAGRAWAFEVGAVSAGAPVALRVAADLMAGDERLRTVVVVAGSREAMLIDYANARSRFLFNFGDGASAAVLVRGLGRNTVRGSAVVTDGSFSHHVRVPAGGSRVPASADTVASGLHAFDVDDPRGMKERLDPVTLDRFVEVAGEAIRRSGRDPKDLGFLAVLHTKRSLYDAILERLGLAPEQSVYLDRYGHVSAADPLIGLWEGERQGRLEDGMLALALSAGTGYTWAATALTWGEDGADA